MRFVYIALIVAFTPLVDPRRHAARLSSKAFT